MGGSPPLDVLPLHLTQEAVVAARDAARVLLVVVEHLVEVARPHCAPRAVAADHRLAAATQRHMAAASARRQHVADGRRDQADGDGEERDEAEQSGVG